MPEPEHGTGPTSHLTLHNSHFAAPHAVLLTSVHPPLDSRIFHREAKALLAGGYRVTLIAPGAKRGEVDGIRLEPLPPSRGGRAGRPLRWPVLLWKALRLRPAIYHIHDPELLPWGLLLQWISRRPVIYDSHEYLREDVEQKHWIPARLRRPVAAAAAAIERFVVRRLAGVVAVTEDMAERFRTLNPNTALVRNLPPAPARVPQPVEREEAVVYAGLMDVTRGLSILYRVAREVRGRLPACEFRIFGPVKWHGLPHGVPPEGDPRWAEAGVTFFGPIPFEQVAGELARARIGWLPLDPEVRNYRLAWPIKLVEYLAAGLPAVATDLPAARGVLMTHECGMLVPGLDPAAHARAMVTLLARPAEAEAMGRRGQRAAHEDYAWESESTELLNLYSALRKGHAYRVDASDR
jgi:glycosyltransferase involved in cell wall biosynthesis